MNPILLIEDEPGLVMTITDLLAAEGHRVESVSDGDAGLAKATKDKFALIILDVMLPKNRLRRLPSAPPIRHRHRYPDAHRQNPGRRSRRGLETWRRRLSDQAL